PPINKLLEITQVIYYENVEVAEFTGLSSKNLKELKDIILENKENFFMLKYLKLLEEADLEIYESHGKIELPDGKYYNLDQFNAPENVYDIDKLILDVAVKDIEKIQNLVNRYNEIQFDLLN
ncbi:MAG: hypothetical protein L0L22_14085, partial [Staphylococcus equorum]|nr:hypothetical protein [Staphylococcus equorum]